MQETWANLQEVLSGMPALQDLTLNLQFQNTFDGEADDGSHRLMGGPQWSSMALLTRLELGLQPILPGPGEQDGKQDAGTSQHGGVYW
jgi:hypothetical protein